MADMANSYEIRWAEDKDWIPAMHMIWKTFLKYEAVDYTEEGIRNFHEFITDEHLYKSFRQGRYQMMVALDGARIIGAASVRNYNHLSLLFVDEEYHHRGVGRSLMGRMCEYLKKEAGERYMSLKAAPYAVDFYRKLGFHAVHAEETFSGIITAGAAFTSMHYVALKIVRNEESYITRSFFKSFKTNFRQATLIWLLILLIAAVLGGDYYIITKSGIQFSSVLVILIMAAAVLVICTALYVFPVLAKFDNTIMGTIRNAFIMSILQLPKTVVMFVMAFFPLIIYLVSLRLIPIIFLFGFSLPAYASAMLYNKFFQKLEDQLVSEQEPAPEVSPEEDERVFHDEIDESIKIEDK